MILVNAAESDNKQRDPSMERNLMDSGRRSVNLFFTNGVYFLQFAGPWNEAAVAATAGNEAGAAGNEASMLFE
ncbi:hypothetical protein V6N11_028550 [Hibiscus sabdariffa]|uniref:Uncharacterized protein n=2 Tax=Hibiscus sabdariffa TaxID=183260 RepID=A0ABR1ZNF2_9ROSI